MLSGPAGFLAFVYQIHVTSSAWEDCIYLLFYLQILSAWAAGRRGTPITNNEYFACIIENTAVLVEMMIMYCGHRGVGGG